MALLEVKDFYRQLEKQPGFSHSIYLFFGSESYLIEQMANRLKSEILSAEQRDFNCQIFNSGDADITEVLDSIYVFPVFAPRRLVWLKDCQKLKDTEWDELNKIYSDPMETTVVLFTGMELDKRKRFFRKILDKGLCVEFKRPFPNQIPSWIRHIAHGLGLEVSEDAVEILHRRLGSLAEVDAELRKLSLFIYPRLRVEAADVETAVVNSREETVFALTEAWGHKDKMTSLKHLANLLDHGQSEMGILAMLARHARILLQIKKAQADGLAGNALAQAVQLSPYFLDSYIGQSRAWSVPQLEQSLTEFCLLDRDLRSSPVSSKYLFESLLL